MKHTRSLHRFKVLELAFIASWAFVSSELVWAELLFNIDFVAVGQRPKPPRDGGIEVRVEPIRTKVL